MECKRVYGELGTLYSQCGGVFGVAAFVDRCMDKWMADPVLNANGAVATWHAKAQRCGFKFLVVQIVGQLTGGPQRYTGRPMDEAHKHLNISNAEWERFMELFNEVCDEFQLPPEIAGDLNALMISMEYDCVVQPGERAPPNPGPARLNGNSLYARCGGVYPLALFVDRLVDALLLDERVQIPYDGQKRTEVSLKYLLTEVVCNIVGGPEVITSKNYDETKLLLPKAAWEIFIATAQIACDHLAAAARAELVQKLQHSKDLIVDGQNDAPLPVVTGGQIGRVNVKSVEVAAAGNMLSSAAIAARHAAPGAHIAARRRVMGDPRTLYGRGGGVFGLAKLADRLMDTWMQNPTLNANAAVARWHESQQKYGFKFLVTQLLGYLTGGPQKYTGVSMEVAHKHLAITTAQWQSFMTDATRVFQEFKIDANTEQELQSILLSFQGACTVRHGEVAPQDPGMCRARPHGDKPYAQLGGVYPIALFADRLVESVKGDLLQVQSDRVEDANGTRHPPGLKYMLTELLCNSAGGPEVVTSKGFDEAKLGVDPEQWPTFLQLVAEAAMLWPTKHHRDLILSMCEKSKVEICHGLEGVEDMPTTDLLAAASGPAFVMSSQCPFSGGTGQCPFSGKTGGKCPVSGQTMGSESAAAVPRSVGASAPPEATSTSADLPLQPMAGRLLDNSFQRRLDELTEEDPDLCCPISLMVFARPVVASDGFIYEKAMLQQLLKNRQCSPMTRESLRSQFRDEPNKRGEAENFRQQRSQDLILFAQDAAKEQPQLAMTALDRASDYLKVLEDKPQDLLALVAQLCTVLGRPVS